MVISKNVPLRELNTFGIDSNTKYLAEIKSLYDIKGLIDGNILNDNQSLILGGGSNVLFTKDFDGIILKNELKGIKVYEESDDHIFLDVASGEDWDGLVGYSVDHNFGGIENLSLIPGTVGAAPIQNIGAYGVEVKDVLEEVEYLDLFTNKIHLIKAADCQFGYRDSIFKNELKGRFFITNVRVKLTKKHVINTSYGAIGQYLEEQKIEKPTITDVREAVINIRKSKLPDPEEFGNAGSFFKNPVVSLDQFEELRQENPEIPSYKVSEDYLKVPAGWLIEKCGWKGYKEENFGVYPKQALVLVNYGRADGKSIKELSKNIQASVFERFNIVLTPEVNII